MNKIKNFKISINIKLNQRFFYKNAIFISFIFFCFTGFNKNVIAIDTNDYSIEDESLILQAKDYYIDMIYNFTDRSYAMSLKDSINLQKYYPFSPYTEQSVVMRVFLNYLLKEYDDIEDIVNDYIKMYPVNVNVPYMLYISALSKYNLVKDEYRVINLIKDTKRNFEYLIKRYPNSIYVSDANQKIQKLDTLIQKNQFIIANYYFEMNQYIPAMKIYSEMYNQFGNQLNPDIKITIDKNIKFILDFFDK